MSWALVLGLLPNLFLSMTFGLMFLACAPIILNPISCPPPPPPPQPLAKAGVGKDCTVCWIGYDFHVATQGGFDYDFVVVKHLVIMMAFRFSHSFQLWLLASLKTSSDHLYCVPLFLKLFAYLGFFFLEIFPIIAQD